MPAGFILHEELRIMQKYGLSPAETLRTAIVNAAAAMGRSAEFGTIEPGKRADMVLLTADPLLDSANLSRIQAVIVRGIVLDRRDLDSIGERIRAIYDHPAPSTATVATRDDVEQMISRMTSLHEHGFVFRTQNIILLAQVLRDEGYTAEAAKISNLQ
jgi:cytosine/adenosine deaminase-related metal-dependent hydrolase